MKRWKPALAITALILTAFAVGFGWQYQRAEELADELAATERTLAFAELRGVLGTAAVEACQGDYEAARLAASDFFTGLQADIERVPDEMAGEFGSILARRDAIITMLSRAEPAARDSLATLFIRYRLTWEAAGEEEHVEAAPSDTTAA